MDDKETQEHPLSVDLEDLGYIGGDFFLLLHVNPTYDTFLESLGLNQ